MKRAVATKRAGATATKVAGDKESDGKNNKGRGCIEKNI